MGADLNVGALTVKKADRTAGLAGLVPAKSPAPPAASDETPKPQKKARRSRSVDSAPEAPKSKKRSSATSTADTAHSEDAPRSQEINGEAVNRAAAPKKIAVTVYVELDVKDWVSATSKTRTTNQTAVVLDCIELAYDHLLSQIPQPAEDTGRRRLFSGDDTQVIRRHDSRTRVQLFLRLTPGDIKVLDRVAIDTGMSGNRSALIEASVRHCMKEETP